MAKVKVGAAGHGRIGQRLAGGVALQGDMELLDVADVTPACVDARPRRKGDALRILLGRQRQVG